MRASVPPHTPTGKNSGCHGITSTHNKPHNVAKQPFTHIEIGIDANINGSDNLAGHTKEIAQEALPHNQQSDYESESAPFIHKHRQGRARSTPPLDQLHGAHYPTP
ncbi:hypothetical protein GCM10007920_20400 [Ciceribacter naphthalenivorans]|uniref:Uncharacterized protein n=2 Tax=Alphaproteobacteria TaxID=28211 RepID=A0A512HLP7_9HYPH|nr:hypothetical protein RNA01_33070 [Ciceribacter naphthalenivorans]GLR22253.1 hypothetical protein GCM10007920_20400 [Ciceribacter naphthalenivorans]GLT05109.1 hypothetical protein GCM10007926_20400 [Sphingomonas psychrolutea]